MKHYKLQRFIFRLLFAWWLMPIFFVIGFMMGGLEEATGMCEELWEWRVDK